MNPFDRIGLIEGGPATTRLGLGTAALGGLYEAVSADDARNALDTAYDLGVRLFDTAPLYGYGLAEARTGEALRSRDRDFVLSTKVGRLLRVDAPPDPSQQHHGESFYRGAPALNPLIDFSAAGVERSLAESRQRLGFDRIDVVYVHDPESNPDRALGEAYPALAAMRRAGEIRAIGAGSRQLEVLARFARETDCDCLLLAGCYTLLDASAADELLPLCQARGVRVVAGGVFNSGVLAQPRPGARFDYVPAPESVLARARELDEVCRAFDVPLMAVAMQFTAAHPAVTALLIGARSSAEVRQCVDLFVLDVPEGLWAELKRRELIPAGAPVPST